MQTPTPDDVRFRRHMNGRIELESDHWPQWLSFSPQILGSYVTGNLVIVDIEQELILIDVANARACYRVVGEDDTADKWICELQFGSIDHPATPYNHLVNLRPRKPDPPVEDDQEEAI